MNNNPQSDIKVIPKQKLIQDLERIGVRQGDTLATPASFKSIGPVEGGPEGFIDALLEAVGPDGTLMMNTFTKSFPIYAIRQEYVFNHKSSICWTGILPKTLRKRKSAIRSKHPVASVVAIGKEAEYLTAEHNARSTLYLPYSKLAEINGKFLAIGIGHNLVAIRHEAQRIAGLFDIVQEFRGVKYLDDEGNVNEYVYNNPPCAKRLPELFPAIRKEGFLREGKIGNAYSILAPAKDLLDCMSRELRRNPAVNLCNDIKCLWCRETERKLDLYEKISDPEIFQRNNFVRTAIARINQIRLKKHRFLSYKTKTTSINLSKIKQLKNLEPVFEEITGTLRFALTKASQAN